MFVISNYKNSRDESKIQFLDTALQLKIYTIKQCKKIPKRLTFLIATDLSDTAKEILIEVKKGNSIYPTNAHEFQLRRDCFLKAYGYTSGLISLIDVVVELSCISGESIAEWMKLVKTEMNALKGILKSDKIRFKNFCDND